MSTTDIIAAVALAVSFASAAVAGISLLLSFRESKRRDEEIRLLRREADRREEELGILRQQFAAGEEERQRQQQAQITVRENVPTINDPARGIEYTVTVQNIGIYPAKDVMVDLVNSRDESVGNDGLGKPLVANEEGTVTVMTPTVDQYSGPYHIFVEWVDGRGRQRQASGLEVNKP